MLLYKLPMKSILFVVSFGFLTVFGASDDAVLDVRKFIRPDEIVTSGLNNNNNNKSERSGVADYGFARSFRRSSSTMRDLFTCVVALDASCLMDRVEDLVDYANSNLLKQADAEAKKMPTVRSDRDKDPTPSSLISTIANMLLEIPELLSDSLSGLVRSGKLNIADMQVTEEEEDDDDDDDADDETDDDTETKDEDEDDDKTEVAEHADEEETEEGKSSRGSGVVRKKCGGKKKGQTCLVEKPVDGDGHDEKDGEIQGVHGHGTANGREVGDARGKKKKKKKEKIKTIIKLLILGIVLKAKITLLLKILAAKLQIKFLLVAAANLIISLVRLWWDLKKGHHEQPQKVIYYEHAQHQHHYDGAEDWQEGPHGGPSGGSYWGRSYESDGNSGQDLAYAKQIPKGLTYSRIDDKPNISWKIRDL